VNLDKVPDENIRSLFYDLLHYWREAVDSESLGNPSDPIPAARARLAEFYNQHQGTEAP
jgi:hypothetical protein